MAAPALLDDEREELLWLRAEWLRQRLTIEQQAGTIQSQQATIAELTGAEPGAAPSVACVYWMYAPTRWHEKSWPKLRAKLIPFVDEYGQVGAHEVTPAVWDAHRVRRLQTPTRMGRPPCDRTLNFSLAEVNAMLKWAVRRGMIRRNPLDGAKTVTVKERRETKVPAAELDALLLAAEDLRDERIAPEDDDGQLAIKFKAFVLCLHDSMLRWGEAMHLRWDRVGADDAVELLGREQKGGRRRLVPLTPRTRRAIGLVRPVAGSPFIFARPATGKPYSYGGFRRWWKKVCDQAGVDHVVAPGDVRLQPRDMRASGATAADEAGVRATAIQTAMGHASLSTTSIYLRSADLENARLVAKALADVTDRRPPKRVSVAKGVTRHSKSKAR